MAARRRRGLDGESADRAIINVTAMRVVSDTVREIKYQILQIIDLEHDGVAVHVKCLKVRALRAGSLAWQKSSNTAMVLTIR
jgi:hypothetical protein